MIWKFQSSPNNISEYVLTSSEGKQVSFKYSRMQRSMRMKYQDHHGVYLLDKNIFGGRKTMMRNVYGSEIGSISRSLMNELAGTIQLDDSSFKLQFKIAPKQNSISFTNGEVDAVCTFAEQVDKEHEEFYLLALMVLSWMYNIGTVQEKQYSTLR